MAEIRQQAEFTVQGKQRWNEVGEGQKSARAGTDLTRFQNLLAAVHVPVSVLPVCKAS